MLKVQTKNQFNYIKVKIRLMERETRFELATPTLARLCSTTELFPHLFLFVDPNNIKKFSKCKEQKQKFCYNFENFQITYYIY